MDESWITSARLDNLLSCFAGLSALIDADDAEWSMLVATDHEEVGSASTVGAQGPMLMDALTALVPEPQDNQQLRTDSWMLSVDNAHAVHPNYADKHDDQHSPRLGGGPVIKINRNQRYATDSEGAARLRLFDRVLPASTATGPLPPRIWACRRWPCTRFASWPVRRIFRSWCRYSRRSTGVWPEGSEDIMSSTRVLTGITTTGTPHLGNYVGAIRPAIAASRDPSVDAYLFLGRLPRADQKSESR